MDALKVVVRRTGRGSLDRLIDSVNVRYNNIIICDRTPVGTHADLAKVGVDFVYNNT